MRTIALAEAKDHFSEIVAAAEAGEEILVTRHGKPAVRIVAATNEIIGRRNREGIRMLAEHRERLAKRGATATTEEMIAWKNEGRR